MLLCPSQQWKWCYSPNQHRCDGMPHCYCGIKATSACSGQDIANRPRELYYLSKSFIAFLVPAVEVLSGVEDKGLSSFYMSELTTCRRKGKTITCVSDEADYRWWQDGSKTSSSSSTCSGEKAQVCPGLLRESKEQKEWCERFPAHLLLACISHRNCSSFLEMAGLVSGQSSSDTLVPGVARTRVSLASTTHTHTHARTVTEKKHLCNVFAICFHSKEISRHPGFIWCKRAIRLEILLTDRYVYIYFFLDNYPCAPGKFLHLP